MAVGSVSVSISFASATQTSVTVNWTATWVNINNSNRNVDVYGSSGSGGFSGTGSALTSGYATISGLSPGTSYTFTIDGYGTDTSGNPKSSSQSITASTLAPSQYTINWIYNDGSGTTSTTYIPVGNSTTSPNPTRSGYTFNGWYTASSGGTFVVSGGSSYAPTQDITLYGQWSVYVPTYTITYNGNGNTGGSTSNTSGTLPLTVSTNGFTKTGYAFAGWNTAANGSGTSYAAGSTYNISSSITLYAQWVIQTPKIYVNGQWIRSSAVKVYVNGSWQSGQLKVYNGTTWVYPQ